jgi:hypothetical protein
VSAVLVGVSDVAARFSGVFLASFAILTVDSSGTSHTTSTCRRYGSFTETHLQQGSLLKACPTDQPCALDFVMHCYARPYIFDDMIKFPAFLVTRVFPSMSMCVLSHRHRQPAVLGSRIS